MRGRGHYVGCIPNPFTSSVAVHPYAGWRRPYPFVLPYALSSACITTPRDLTSALDHRSQPLCSATILTSITAHLGSRRKSRVWVFALPVQICMVGIQPFAVLSPCPSSSDHGCPDPKATS